MNKGLQETIAKILDDSPALRYVGAEVHKGPLRDLLTLEVENWMCQNQDDVLAIITCT